MFRAIAAALVFLSLACAPPAAAVGAAPAVDATSSPERGAFRPADGPRADQSPSTIEIETALSLTPDDPGSIGVVQTFDTPETVTALSVTLDPRATVTDSEGFSRVSEYRWEWDGETDTPRLRYGMAANRTVDRDGPLGAEGSYLYADPGPWALVRQPNIGLQANGAERVERSTRVDGEGAVGDTIAFLGPHEVHTREADGQEIRLLVPAAADLEDPPERVLDTLANASRTLRVGGRDPTVFAVAAPTGRVEWGVRGLQTGDSDFWARAGEPIDQVGNTWLHEYVHTRQSFRTAASGRWLTEASATWYAALLSQQQAGVSFDEFSQFLARGTASPQSGSVLSEPTTWANNANYWKGALAAGELDRRIRLATDGGATLQRVFASLNDRTAPVTNGDVLAAVDAASTASVRERAERVTTTSETPEVWNRSAQRAAFGGDTALIGVGFDPESDLRVTGPYRNATAATPVTLAAGETLALRTTVDNQGGASGEYAVTLRVDDGVVDRGNGTLGPDETTTETLTHRFAEPGRYTVSVAGERLAVRVLAPATPTVTDVAVDRPTVERGESVTVDATAANDESVPGNATVAFTRDGETVATRTVTVDPGERETVSAEVTMPDAGVHRVGAGDRAVDVRVEEPPTATAVATATQPASTTSGPGFGAVVALGSIAAAAGLGRLFAGERRGR